MGARSYSEATIKRLWALSGNQCYMPECKVPLAYVEHDHVIGEIAHIRAASPTGCRYDATMDDRERASFANLLLMCPTHHVLIDRVACDQWGVDELERMKAAHEAANHPTSLPADVLTHVARVSLARLTSAARDETTDGNAPRRRTSGLGTEASGGVPVPKDDEALADALRQAEADHQLAETELAAASARLDEIDEQADHSMSDAEVERFQIDRSRAQAVVDNATSARDVARARLEERRRRFA